MELMVALASVFIYFCMAHQIVLNLLLLDRIVI